MTYTAYTAFNTVHFVDSALRQYDLTGEGVSANNVADAVIATAREGALDPGLNQDIHNADRLRGNKRLDLPVGGSAGSSEDAKQVLTTSWGVEVDADTLDRIVHYNPNLSQEGRSRFGDRGRGYRDDRSTDPVAVDPWEAARDRRRDYERHHRLAHESFADEEAATDWPPRPKFTPRQTSDEDISHSAEDIVRDNVELLLTNGAAARAINERRSRVVRRYYGAIILGSTAIGLIAGVAFNVATGDHPIKLSVPEIVTTKTVVPHVVNRSVGVSAGSLNALAANYEVPASSVTVDRAAIDAAVANARAQGLTLKSVAITGEASEAAVAPDGNTYQLPPTTLAEREDVQAEIGVAAQRAADARTAVEQVVGGDVSVTTTQEVVAPTEVQQAELNEVAHADHTTVAALAEAYDQNAESVPVNAREILKAVLSDNQGFTAKFKFIGQATKYLTHKVYKQKTVEQNDPLTAAKDMIDGVLGFFGAGIGYLVAAANDTAEKRQRRAARRVSHLAREN